jgi:hypothetical protein
LTPRFSTCAVGRTSAQLAPTVALLAVLAACAGEPRVTAFAPSPVAAVAPRPSLGETQPLREAFAQAEPAAERLAVAAEGLADRSEALRGRASALEGPVIDPDRRDRMLAAAAGG